MKIYPTTQIVIFVFVFSLLFSYSYAQENSMNKTRFSDLQLQFGIVNTTNDGLKFEDYSKLIANSKVLDTFSISKYNLTHNANSTSSSYFNLLATLQFKNWKKGELRFGVASFSNQTLGSAYSRSIDYRADTLTSTSGEQIFIDTTVTYGLNVRQQSDFLRLEVAAIFRTSEEKRFQFFTGFGISTSIGYRSIAHLDYSRSVSSNDDTGQNSGPGNSYGETKDRITEESENKVNFIHSLYVPLGAELKLHKLQEPKHKFSIYAEFKPGIHLSVIPELSTTFNVGLQGGLGVRYRF